jgi:hypothetical protein
MPEDAVKNSHEASRTAGEFATAYVMLANPLSSYMSGTTMASPAANLSSDGRLKHPMTRQVCEKWTLTVDLSWEGEHP